MSLWTRNSWVTLFHYLTFEYGDADDGGGHDDDDKDKVQSNQRHNFLGHIPRPFGSKGSEAIRAAESRKWEQRNIGTYRVSLKKGKIVIVV